MYPFAALLALGLCAEPQDKLAGGTDAVKPVADITRIEADVRRVLDRLESIEKGLAAIEKKSQTMLGQQGENLQAQLNDINKKITDLRTDMDDLKKARISASAKPVEPTMPMASVMLVNARPDMPMETVVNGATYWVEPNQNRVVSVPAGAVQVRVVYIDAAARDRTLQAGAMHVVTLR